MIEFVPTLNDTQWDVSLMVDMWRRLSGGGQLVEFNFTGCRFLRQNAVAFLGGLARMIEHRGGQVVFRWDTLDSAVATNLGQNGFMSIFGGPLGPWAGNSIPLREDRRQDAIGFCDYLTRLWLGRGWLNISPGLRDAIAGRVAEIYLNAFEHSTSPVGVLACGQRFPNKKKLDLTIVDFGVGIPSNVRLFHAGKIQPEQLPAARCMEWAFQPGTSTRMGGRGIGLDLLHDFVRKNGGRLEMFSHEGYVAIADGQISFAEQKGYFEGTLVNISLKCDDSFYCLASEIDKEPLI
jgi:signal transduction histidine kinase